MGLTFEEWAERLNGRQYREEITRDECSDAKRDSVVVMFGASDDLCELRGAIEDEVSCYDGGKFLIDSKGIVPSRGSIDPERMSDDEIRDILDRRRNAATIEVEWHDGWAGEDGPAWTYKVPFPHATFEIHDDEGLYCQGVVFSAEVLP